jgi:kinesin family protein 18/19
VFAYGATGAGKTHTMLGNSSYRGVMVQTVEELYARITREQEKLSCEVTVSYLEVYNEKIRDLLSPGPDLAIRDDAKQGACVSNLSMHKPQTAQALLCLLDSGNSNRTQHPTDANATSSRSHAVFCVYVKMRPLASGLRCLLRACLG